MSKVNLNVDYDLADEVLIITQNKFPRRKISFYSEAIKEALIEFVKENQKFKDKKTKSKNPSIKPEAST